MSDRLKTIIVWQVIVLLLLIGAEYSSQALANWVTEDLPVEYLVNLTQ